MLVRKISICAFIFLFMFLSAWLANDKVTLERVPLFKSSESSKGARALSKKSLQFPFDEPFKPREYIRVYPRPIP